ncbi:MAG: molybdopterin molybdotransferase MoeA [Acidimicrobiales bacterium]
MGLIPLEEARQKVLAACPRLTPRALALADALGCVLASDVHAEVAVPPFGNSAVDGYAVRARDTEAGPCRLQVLGTLAAGAGTTRQVGPGQTVRIMTGAPVPTGADAIVMVEDTRTEADGAVVMVERPARAGQHVRAAGEDVSVGQMVFGAGTVLGPGHLGVLASVGLAEAVVFPPVRVGVLSTGDELAHEGRPLGASQIHDANRPTLLALLRQAGCVAVDLGLVGDDEAAITTVMGRAASDCDALVTSGGVSVGDFDYLEVVLARLGRVERMQIAIKPAKPFALGVIDVINPAAGASAGTTPVFGLPGNPVSSMVSFELLARPSLRQMMGHAPGDLDRPRIKARAEVDLSRRPDGKVHFLRVAATMDDEGRWRVRPSGGQGSHQLRAMALANALAVLPDGPGVAADAEVEVLLLR